MNTKNNELEYTDRSNGNGSWLTGLIFGSIVGAATMLFLAPQSGRKTRAEVQKGAEQLRNRTTEVMKDRFEQVKNKTDQIKTEVKVKAANIEHKGKDMLAKQLDNVSQAAKAGKEAIQTS
ncbi:MAG TPA: YtxH domain-containing protein [Anaerolineales bacterium]|nr:YtxH domain-containing protein [Anaerolineales bacterium]